MTTQTLKEMQARFGDALRSADTTLPLDDGAPDFVERFAVYRNNSWQFFLAALEQTYPVLQRRVGHDYFRTLAHEFRATHVSRGGDLHWAGAGFAAWLEQRLADTGYEWLADLARLEWACAEASIAAQLPPLALTQLGAHPPERLAGLRLRLQPSLRLVAARFPVWTVWHANQAEVESDPVDLAQGGEWCVVACVGDQPVAYRVSANDYLLVERLRLGDTLDEVLDAVAGDTDALSRVLAWSFAENLIVGIVSPYAPA